MTSQFSFRIGRGFLPAQICKICKGRKKGLTEILHFYKKYKEAAKRRKYDFNLSLNDFANIITQNCHYCGIEPQRFSKQIIPEWSRSLNNGIDRIDNNKGYILSNCLPCCSTCNSAKHNMSYENFMKYLDRLVLFYENK